jgi:hypothetical protein
MRRVRVPRFDHETSVRLQEAIRQGDVATLSAFSTDARAWLHQGTAAGDKPLLAYAAWRGTAQVVDALLQSGCDPNEPLNAQLLGSDYHAYVDYDVYVDTALGRAVASTQGVFPDVDIVRLLLAHGALVNGHPSGSSSPLSWAAINGNLPAAKLLIEAGADPYWEGWRYGPAVDEGIEAQVIGSGSEKVAEYLRSLGATVTYLEWHHWEDRQLECIERTLGVVNPRPYERSFGGTAIAVYKARFAQKVRRYEHWLLFTRGLAPHLKAEVGLVVSRVWPLNKGAMLEQRFSWPVELLFRIAAAVLAGARLEHGSVVRATDEVLGGFETPVPEWLVVTSGAIEEKRALGGWTGTVPVLLLTPVLTKKRYKPGKEAVAEADKRSGWSWGRLHLPLPNLIPVGYAYLEDQYEVSNSPKESD